MLERLRRLEIETPSWGNPDAGVRAEALAHCRECVGIAHEVGSTIVSLWLANGTDYPGQDDLRARYRRLLEGLDDVRTLLARLREAVGVDPDPVEAFRRGGHAERLARERGTASVESAYERP